MWVKVRQVIRDKRTGLVVLGVVAIGCMMFTYQQGYDQGQDAAYGQWATWEEVCQEEDLDKLGGESSAAEPWPVTCLYYRLQQDSYLPAEPDLGESPENPAR